MIGMSVQPTLLNRELSDYIVSNFSSEDEFLRNLRNEAASAGIPEICISPEQGAFLQFLIRAANVGTILEIGSLAGYSAITMARALPNGGKLTALEIELECAHFIKRKTIEAGLSDKIEVVNTDAGKYLDALRPGDTQFDMVFLDADKPNYISYFERCAPLLRKGGILAADNALAFGELLTEYPKENTEVLAIRHFNEFIKNRQDFMSCLVPVGDGMTLSVKL